MPAGHPGFRVLPAPPRISDDLLDRFRGLASSNVADAMGRFGFMDAGMQSRSGLALCGLAVTVQCRPADNLMVHQALEVAQPGDIVVVSTCGNTTSAVFGELMCHTATGCETRRHHRRRRRSRCRGKSSRLGFPRTAAAVCPGSCDKDGLPGRSMFRSAAAALVVSPGDIIVGDADGIAVVPRESAAEVLARVVQLMDRESKRIAEIDAGPDFQSRDRRNSAEQGSHRVTSPAAPLLLMTPGPTRVPDRVLRAGARPMIHHRTREFSAELATVVELLMPVSSERAHRCCPCTPPVAAPWKPPSAIYFLPATKSRSAATESSVKCGLVLRNRTASRCIASAAIGRVPVDVMDIARARSRRIQRSAPSHSHTLIHPQASPTTSPRSRARFARCAPRCWFWSTACRRSGGMPFAFDSWGVDFAATASQKCSMSSPDSRSSR